jgi:type II secretory pathway component PulC
LLALGGGCKGSAETTSPEPARADAPSTGDDAVAEPAPVAGEVAEARGPRPPATIYRSELELALSRGPGFLLGQLAPEPYRLSGRFVGWEITRIFPDLPQLCADGCDLQVGDVILSVNGDRLETPQAFSNMIDALPSMDRLVVKSLRDEKRRVATYTLVDG